MQIVLATRNQHKKQELVALLGGMDITIRTLDDFPDAPDVVEDGETCEANAMKKAVEIARYTVAARYAGEQASYEDNWRKLLQELRGIPAEDRGARFITVAAIAFPAGKTFSTKGVLEGVIAEEATGSRGFGYDPVFFLPEYHQTLAQLSPDVKNRISHRARAFTQARNLLEQMMAEQNSVGA